MTATALRPRTAVEIIDAAFQLMRKNYFEMVAVAGVIIIPLAIAELLFPLEFAVPIMIVRTLFSLVAIGAIIHVASNSYMGEEIRIGDSLRLTLSRFFPLLAAVLIQTIVVLFGFLFLIIPGILLTAWLFAMPALVILEGRGPFESVGRSYELARGYVLKIFGIFLLTYLIYGMLFLALGVFAAIGGTLRIGEQSIGFIANVLSVLIMPVWACVVTLIYYDLRIRKEAFDLQVAAGRLEGAGV